MCVSSGTSNRELNKSDFAKLLAEVESKRTFAFEDKRYLDPLYSSSDFLVGREPKTKELLKHLVDKTGYAEPFIQVYGKSGTGKTSVVKYICENLGDAFCCVVNLRQAKTIFGCVNIILEELDLPPLKNASGLGTAVRTIEKQIESIMAAKDNKKLFVLVLDEIDVVFRDTRGDPSDFIYKLLLLQERLRQKRLMMTIIGVSNGVISDYDLDERVRSRLGTTEVFFDSYTKEQIISILKKRAKKAFAFNLESGVLQYCAELASMDHGDARRAIDLLRRSAEMAEMVGETRKITKKNIDDALEDLEKDRVTMTLAKSPYHLKVVAAVIAKMTYVDQSTSAKDKWYTTPMIQDEYRRFLQDKSIETWMSKTDLSNLEGRLPEMLDLFGDEIKPLSYRRVSSLLTELCDMGNTGWRHRQK
jgi:cell division control protein 6